MDEAIFRAARDFFASDRIERERSKRLAEEEERKRVHKYPSNHPLAFRNLDSRRPRGDDVRTSTARSNREAIRAKRKRAKSRQWPRTQLRTDYQVLCQWEDWENGERSLPRRARRWL